ncbi:MAG: carboxypeptidase-like regulatory domain-containing protein [Chlorobi bacterium]|nr:carboxypeptidase-like regulatory domain-containing protein [Chlorobiota bacterium]
MKKHQTIYLSAIIISLFFISITNSYSQKTTRIRGKVINAETKEPIPFANIVFVGKNIGTTTDYKGEYSLQTQWASNKVQAAYIGFKSSIKKITVGKNQTVNFQLQPENISIGEVVVKSKRKRYRNKNNPAVELIKKVIKNKDNNRKESLDFYEYEKYEKIEFDLNNITEKFRKKRVFKQYQFIFNYVDTSEINGKPYLPVFLRETLSKVYYRKSPKAYKEYVTGTKSVGSKEYIDSEGTDMMVDYLYQDIDLYNNEITLLTNQFISPISSIAPVVYKFRIIDTITVNNRSCINLAFQPRNKLDFAFIGNLYITNDDKYSVIKAEMGITDDINLNFVTDLHINQEFEFINNQCWMLTKDELIIDFNIAKKGAGMFGKRSVIYDNYVFNKKRDESIYSGIEKTVKEENYDKRDDEFWKQNRLEKLSKQEADIYTMVDSVQHMPAFKRTMDILTLLVAGYWNFGKFNLGPVNTFYSFNDVEGFRLRIGGRTSEKFSKRLRLEGYGLYGFKDKKYKYSGSIIWALNNKPIKSSTRHTISAMYQVETNFPGMEMQFINEDNFLLSFKRGVADKILYYEMLKIEHYRDWKNGFSTTFNLKHVTQEPGGTLRFDYDDRSLSSITTSEITAVVRFAPNEKYIQGYNYRIPMFGKYPIIQVSYTQGLEALRNADFTYGKLSLNLFKRIHLAPLGFTNFELEAGKIFGSEIPFPLMFIHRANQTYSYQLHSYNMMNFLEFVSDEYVSVFAEHHFYGFFFNKIPLLKRLKWREVISAKGIYGGVTDKNNPEVTPGLMKFPTDEYGNTTTYTLTQKPYIEISAGIENIFKFFRVDIVKRVTYLNNPNVSEYGIRARFKFDF